MTADTQKLLPLFEQRPESENVKFLVEHLRGQDWRTAAQICEAIHLPFTESNRRRLRAIADKSGGRIAGGQRGYKLVAGMTGEEFSHWRNWMKHQADEMTRRVLEADKVFYTRQPVAAGNGIL